MIPLGGKFGHAFQEARQTGEALLGLAQARLEILTVEFQEEQFRVVRRLLWLALGVGLAMVGLLLAVATLALFLWEWTGYAGLIALVLGLFLGAGVVLFILRRQMHEDPPAFAQTLSEFKKDRECLQSKDELN